MKKLLKQYVFMTIFSIKLLLLFNFSQYFNCRMPENWLSFIQDLYQQTLSSQYTKKQRFMYKAYVKHACEFSTMKEVTI